MQAFLSIRKLTRHFSGLTALDAVSFDVAPGQIVGLIGPNGAGKTTLINLVTGVMAPSAGEVLLGGASLVGLKPHLIARRGVARTFQHIRLFEQQSILENVMTGLDLQMSYGYAASALGLPQVRAQEARAREEALEILGQVDPRLRDRSALPCTALSYADKRRVEIARALALKPSLLLLDEPAAGMAPQEIHTLAQDLRRLHSGGMSIILIEHKMRLIEGVTDKVVVLDHGRKIFEGPFEVVKHEPEVIKAYLGSGYANANTAVVAGD